MLVALKEGCLLSHQASFFSFLFLIKGSTIHGLHIYSFIFSVQVDEVSPSISLRVIRTEGTYGQVSVMYYSQSVTEDTDTGTDYRLVPGVTLPFTISHLDILNLLMIISVNNVNRKTK